MDVGIGRQVECTCLLLSTGLGTIVVSNPPWDFLSRVNTRAKAGESTMNLDRNSEWVWSRGAPDPRTAPLVADTGPSHFGYGILLCRALGHL